MKAPILTALASLLALFQAGLWLCPDAAARAFMLTASAVIAVAIAAAGITGWLLPSPKKSQPSSTPEAPSQSSTAPSPPAPQHPPPPRAEAELAAFLALLQEHGRLVDFLQEDISSASDAEIGAAARVVHAGCRKVLTEYLTIQPVRSEPEGTSIELPTGYDASAHRLLGSVPDNPPYKGRIIHCGWQAVSIRLPQIAELPKGRPWPVLAPAEVEIQKT